MFYNRQNTLAPAGKKDNGAFFQPKLTVNEPGDMYEQEADAVADKVAGMPDAAAGGSYFNPSPLNVQRKCQHCEEEEKSMHRKESSNDAQQVTGNNEAYINSLNGKGSPLPQSERNFFEPRMGYDFSSVRIHTGSEAEKSASGVNALAYTHGNNIVFNANQYQPGSASGKKLLAHELTHTIQQQSTVSPKRIQRIPGQPQPQPAPVTSESNNSVSETISNAPAAYSGWNNSFTWNSKFQVVYNPTTKRATIVTRLYCTAASAVLAGWETAIENRWGGGQFEIEIWEGCIPKIVPIDVDIQWVNDPATAHYTITANQPGATAGGRAGIGGTTGMTEWGVADTTDVTHEYGHMLGNPEEYFTTNGVDYTRGGTRTGFRDPGAGIMNNPAESPAPRHYEMVRTAFVNMMHLSLLMVRVVQHGSSNPPLVNCGDFPTPRRGDTAVA